MSGLSPWIQRRLVLEREAVQAAKEAHGSSSAEKFIQEVLWRTYWKGWLEMRPSVWDDFRGDLQRDARLVAANGRLGRAYGRACRGETGIDCFDHWCRELRETGYLHNHARMWFASIWIFTLQLPWTLGAALFEHHLLDADAASNTLGWRWVAGLHTRGKHYLARASNIRRFTGERFDPAGQLAAAAEPRRDEREHPREPLPQFSPVESDPRSGLLLTAEDLSPEHSELRALDIVAVAGGLPQPVLGASERVVQFHAAAMEDGLKRASTSFEASAHRLDDGERYLDEVRAWAIDRKLERVVAIAPAVGPWSDVVRRLHQRLRANGIQLALHRRAWDRRLFPHATAGYFKFKKIIPELLRDL